LQQGFNHPDQKSNSTTLFSHPLFSTSFPKWHYPGLLGSILQAVATASPVPNPCSLVKVFIVVLPCGG
jgi:hypothetical protein